MFSENLKYLRRKHNLEQIDLAHKLGRKSASSISEWEKGKYTPKMKVLTEISSLFDVNIDDLMTKDLSNVSEKEQPTTIAMHLDGEDLTEEEWKDVQEYIDFIRQKRNK